MRLNKEIIILINGILLILFLTSCNEVIDKKRASIITPTNLLLTTKGRGLLEECINPAETFAYSVSIEGNIKSPEITLPPENWSVEAILLDNSRFSELLGTRFSNGLVELWILADPSDQNLDNHSPEFQVFYPEMKKWKIIPAEIKNEKDTIRIVKLFFTKDGSVYGVSSFSEFEEIPAFSILSKYNEQIGAFELVEGAKSIPAFSSNSDNTFNPPKVLLDAQGMLFWILVPDDAIYSYNPVTQEGIKRKTLLDSETTELMEAVYSPEGNIYFLSIENRVFSNNQIWLYQYNTVSGSLEKYAIGLEPWPLADHLFADHSGRLWFGAVGWREANGNWYQLFSSPIFLTGVRWSGMDYRWKSPEILLESSDHRLWYRSYENGMVWLDPSKEEWCWFTTYHSNIAEDQLHNLWIIIDGKLYKYPLYP